MKLGAQLYTVRDYCKDLDSFEESLKKIADIGYKYVQVSGTCDFDAQWLKKVLDSTGIICSATHVNRDLLASDPQKVSDDHKVFGCDYIGLGWYNIKENGFADFYEKYINTARTIRDNNQQFMYHNHDLEFEKIDGKLILDQLIEKFTAKELAFCLDTFWAQAGGYDPAQLIEKLGERAPCVHLKDMTYNKRMEVVGEGNMNWERILASCEKVGTKYAFVEQDNCNDENPFDCLKRSYEYLHSFGLE